MFLNNFFFLKDTLSYMKLLKPFEVTLLKEALRFRCLALHHRWLFFWHPKALWHQCDTIVRTTSPCGPWMCWLQRCCGRIPCSYRSLLCKTVIFTNDRNPRETNEGVSRVVSLFFLLMTIYINYLGTLIPCHQCHFQTQQTGVFTSKKKKKAETLLPLHILNISQTLLAYSLSTHYNFAAKALDIRSWWRVIKRKTEF